VRADAHEAVGGIEGVANGEDRKFFEALRRMDAKIRHAPEIVVTVSGRLVGRATGGMAETMMRRMRTADEWLDADLETAQRRARRARLRAAVTQARAHGASRLEIGCLATELRVSVPMLQRALMAPTMGAGWCDLERVSPTLMRVPVPLMQLATETGNARALVRELRGQARISVPIYPVDTGLPVSAGLASRVAASPE
jgi:hypothetical protein